MTNAFVDLCRSSVLSSSFIFAKSACSLGTLLEDLVHVLVVFIVELRARRAALGVRVVYRNGPVLVMSVT